MSRRVVKEDGEMVILDTLIGGSDAIERQEARGQASLVNSTSLPVDRGRGQADDEIYNRIGITFGEPHEDDPIFCDAEIPEGWAMKATGHSMWSELVDDKGRVRANIFYKAAFYDRSAHMSLVRRYAVIEAEFSENVEQSTGFVVLDRGTVPASVIHSEEVPPRPPKGSARGTYRDWYDVLDAARVKAESWLEERFPEYTDPSAYWNEMKEPTL